MAFPAWDDQMFSQSNAFLADKMFFVYFRNAERNRVRKGSYGHTSTWPCLGSRKNVDFLDLSIFHALSCSGEAQELTPHL